jgi:hypothetical protein
VVVSIVALLVFAGLGGWAAFTLPWIPLLAPAGAVIGAALGIIAVALLLHDSDAAASGDGVRLRWPRPH